MENKAIAYLATDIPSLSETFVYEELLALERRGFLVKPFALRRPPEHLRARIDLADRVEYLYESNPVMRVLSGVVMWPTFGRYALKSLHWLLEDMAICGWTGRQAWKLAYQYISAVSLARRLVAYGCAHLHIHFAHSPAQVGMYAAGLADVPFTITGHANDIFQRGLLLKQKAERAKKFITISEFNRRHLEKSGLPSEKLAVVRCGVSFPPRHFDAGSAENGQAAFKIGTLGRLIEKKGVDVLIRAVAWLAGKALPVELVIAGDGPLRVSLESLAVELGVQDRVRFMGSMSHAEVSEWMRGLDAFVLACKQDSNGDMDGIPVVLMEAMSQGVPVVSTVISGIPELILDQETGLLAAPDDAAALAARIEQLAQSVDDRRRFAEAALSHVTREFGQDVNIDRLIEVIQSR